MSISRANRSGIKVDTAPKKTRSVQDASGLPGPVRNISSTVIGNNQINLSWTAPEIVGDSAVTSYSIVSIPAGGSATVSGTTASITGLSPGTSYDFDITPINSVGQGYRGRGGNGTTTNWNDASGGTISTVSNYNGTGQTWKIHSFSSSSTFTVNSGPSNFSTLVVGGGGGGGCGQSVWNGGGGGGGGARTYSTTTSLSNGAYTVTVGGGGGACGGSEGGGGGAGGQSKLGPSITANGGGGGAGGCCGNGGAGPVSGGTIYTITGSPVRYGQNGGSGGNNPNYGPRGAAPGGGGGGAVIGSGGPYATGNQSGHAGIVIAAYRVG